MNGERTSKSSKNDTNNLERDWDIIKMLTSKDEQCITLAEYIFEAGYMHHSSSIFPLVKTLLSQPLLSKYG